MKLTKKQRNKQKVTMTVKELEKTKENATKNAVQITQLFPLWVLRNQGWGEKRIRRFMDEYDELWDAYNRGYVSLVDIAQQLEKETGIRVGERVEDDT